jgi:hypothetical protein
MLRARGKAVDDLCGIRVGFIRVSRPPFNPVNGTAGLYMCSSWLSTITRLLRTHTHIYIYIYMNKIHTHTHTRKRVCPQAAAAVVVVTVAQILFTTSNNNPYDHASLVVVQSFFPLPNVKIIAPRINSKILLRANRCLRKTTYIGFRHTIHSLIRTGVSVRGFFFVFCEDFTLLKQKHFNPAYVYSRQRIRILFQ